MTDASPKRVIDRLQEFVDIITDISKPANWSEFYMRIPADPNRDADIIFSRAISLLTVAYSCQNCELVYDGNLGWMGIDDPDDRPLCPGCQAKMMYGEDYLDLDESPVPNADGDG